MFKNKMFGVLLLAAQLAYIFALTQSGCVFGDAVCWTNLANNVLVPKLAAGIPEIGIERMDNFQLKDIDIKDIDIKDKTVLKITNATVSGFENAFVEDTRNYSDFKLIRVVIKLNLTIVGDYSVQGIFFRLPISGSGKLTVLLHNVRIHVLAPYDIIKLENGKNSIDFIYLKKSFHSYGGIHFNFEDKDENNRDFGEKVNFMINDNWRVFEGYGAEAWSDITQQIFNGFKVVLATYEFDI